MIKTFFITSISIIMLSSCDNSGNTKDEKSTTTDSVQTSRENSFEKTIDGKQTHLFILQNKNIKAAITNYGGRLVSLWVPDKNGKMVDVVEGFESVDGYINSTEPYFGATIGRYGNRIAKGKFKIDGVEYSSSINNPPNMLHGGKNGFQSKVFDAKKIGDSSLELSYLSKDGEEGFPGNLNVKLTYTLTDNQELKLDYEATTDKKTVVNLTNHAFWNLNGEGSGTILNHTLWINADQYTPVDSTLIPTGKIETVKGTPFDFTGAEKIGARIDSVKGGYDHNFVLNAKDSTLKKVATLSDAVSGRQLEVYTTEPGLQFYTGNFLDGTIINRDGKPIPKNAAFCMETQHYPDSPNKPEFPSSILKPGGKYHTETKYKVSVNK